MKKFQNFQNFQKIIIHRKRNQQDKARNETYILVWHLFVINLVNNDEWKCSNGNFWYIANRT